MMTKEVSFDKCQPSCSSYNGYIQWYNWKWLKLTREKFSPVCLGMLRKYDMSECGIPKTMLWHVSDTNNYCQDETAHMVYQLS